MFVKKLGVANLKVPDDYDLAEILNKHQCPVEVGDSE